MQIITGLKCGLIRVHTLLDGLEHRSLRNDDSYLPFYRDNHNKIRQNFSKKFNENHSKQDFSVAQVCAEEYQNIPNSKNLLGN